MPGEKASPHMRRPTLVIGDTVMGIASVPGLDQASEPLRRAFILR